MFEYLPDNVAVEETVKNNIANCAFAKIKKEKQKKLIKTLTTVAASFLIVICSMWAVGFENVAAAAQRFFNFIPGFGIVEEYESPTLVAKKAVTRGNEIADITVCQAMPGRSDNDISGLLMNIQVKYKNNMPEYDYNNFEFELKVGNEVFTTFKFNETSYSSENWFSINGLWIYTKNTEFKSGQKCILTVKGENIGTIKIPFKLVNIEKLDNTRSITLGDISINACKYTTKVDGKKYIAVDVFSNHPENLSRMGEGSMFVTAEGEPIPADFCAGTTSYYLQERLPKDSVFEIEYISFREIIEEKDYTIPIPADGKSEKLNISVPFSFGTINISKVTRERNKLVFDVEYDTEKNISAYVYFLREGEWPTTYIEYAGDRSFTIEPGIKIDDTIDVRYDKDFLNFTVEGLWFDILGPMVFDFD